MQSFIDFVVLFFQSKWERPLDYLIAVAVLACCYVYVYILHPKPNKAPNPFEHRAAGLFSLSDQDKRYAVMVLFITLAYLVMRVLGVMQAS